MKISILHTIFFSLFVFLVRADVTINKPEAGATFTAGSKVTVDWDDDGKLPDVDTAKTYSFVLLTGTNALMKQVALLDQEVPATNFAKSLEYTFTATPTFGTSGLYFVQIVANYKDRFTLHYSGRFFLTGMTGTTITATGIVDQQATPQTSLLGGKNDDAPTGTTGLDLAVVSRSMTVPYILQTGLSRYAPMQVQPGTKVTATTWTRKHPTSSVSYFTALVPSPACISTVTPGWDYIITSAMNWASPAPAPSEAGGWYSPGARITSRPTLKSRVNLKKKRWIDY